MKSENHINDDINIITTTDNTYVRQEPESNSKNFNKTFAFLTILTVMLQIVDIQPNQNEHQNGFKLNSLDQF